MPRSLQSSEPVELPECLKWRYTKIAPTTARGAYMLAGPPLAFECHHPVRRTFPCYKLLKGCTLECPWCRWKRQFSVYVPLFDINEPKNVKIVVCGGKKTHGDVKSMAVGSMVMLSRGTHVRDTLRIRPWPEVIDPHTYRRWRAKCVDDISPYLFHLWQRRELTEHFGHTYFPSLQVVANESKATSLDDDIDMAVLE